MIQAVLFKGLTGAATVVNKLAALAAPRLALDVYPHRLYASSEGRTWRHRDVYRDGPGSVTIELGGWDMDVSWKARAKVKAGAV